MRIGLVLPSPPKYSETFLNSLIEVLKNGGNNVIVFTGEKTAAALPYECVNAYKVDSSRQLRQFIKSFLVISLRFITNPSASFKLFGLDRAGGSSIINSLKSIYINAHILPYKLHWLHFGYATMALHRENAAKAIGAKMSVSLRGFDINVYPLKDKNCYAELWRRVDKVHTISEYLRNKAIALGLREDTPYEKISPAVDTKNWKLKDNIGVIQNPVKVFTSGRLNWIKDFETAITAMGILRDMGINFIYNIAGDGHEHERLVYVVHQLKLDDRIFFLGKLSHRDIHAKMTASDIYLQTSLQEGFCVSVLEAQSTGTICIVSDADGLKENVINNETGFIVAKRKPELFAEKIIEVIGMSDNERKQIILSARERVESNFGIELQQKKFENFFKQ